MHKNRKIVEKRYLIHPLFSIFALVHLDSNSNDNIDFSGNNRENQIKNDEHQNKYVNQNQDNHLCVQGGPPSQIQIIYFQILFLFLYLLHFAAFDTVHQIPKFLHRPYNAFDPISSLCICKHQYSTQPNLVHAKV